MKYVIVLITLLLIISLIFNIRYYYHSKSSTARKENLMNTNEELVDAIDDSSTKIESLKKRLKSYISSELGLKEFIKHYIIPDRPILGHSNLNTVAEITVLNNTYDEDYLNLMTDKYGDANTPMTFQYPQSRDLFNLIQSEYKEKLAPLHAEIDEL